MGRSSQRFFRVIALPRAGDETSRTVSTKLHKGTHHVVAYGEFRNVRSYLLDYTCQLMTEYGWKRNAVIGLRQVKIRMAKACRFDGHENLFPDRIINLDLLDLETARDSVQNGCFHKISLIYAVA
jgi:hypothetical protein